MDLISIIVPVYNAEPYLDRCIRSLVNQTYPNVEIVLVNDGSTDLSLSICESWAIKDERVRVLSQQNGGVSSASNAGLDAASSGKWCCLHSAVSANGTWRTVNTFSLI